MDLLARPSFFSPWRRPYGWPASGRFWPDAHLMEFVLAWAKVAGRGSWSA